MEKTKTETEMVERPTEPRVSDEPSDNKVVWKSGCLHTDKDAVKFFCTYLLSLLVLSFAFYMVAKDEDDSQLALWSSMITGIASQYLPSPINEAMKKNN
jgi:hypothetical protein